MRKIHVTRPFFEASGPQAHFFDKAKKKTFLDMVKGSVGIKFQICINFRLARRSRTAHIHKPTDIISQVKLGISSTGCSPHVDFENALRIVQPYKLLQ